MTRRVPVHSVIGRFQYIAWVKCPYRVVGKASALRAAKQPPGCLDAHTELRAKRQRSARDAIYRNQPIVPSCVMMKIFSCGVRITLAVTFLPALPFSSCTVD